MNFVRRITIPLACALATLLSNRGLTRTDLLIVTGGLLASTTGTAKELTKTGFQTGGKSCRVSEIFLFPAP